MNQNDSSLNWVEIDCVKPTGKRVLPAGVRGIQDSKEAGGATRMSKVKANKYNKLKHECSRVHQSKHTLECVNALDLRSELTHSHMTAMTPTVQKAET